MVNAWGAKMILESICLTIPLALFDMIEMSLRNEKGYCLYYELDDLFNVNIMQPAKVKIAMDVDIFTIT